MGSSAAKAMFFRVLEDGEQLEIYDNQQGET